MMSQRTLWPNSPLISKTCAILIYRYANTLQNLSILSQVCNFAVFNRVMMQHNRSSMFAICQLSACRSSSICKILSSSFFSGARDGCSVRMGQTSTSLLPHPFSEIHTYPSSWMRYPPVCATPANALVMSSGATPFALRYIITPSSSSPQKIPSMK